MVLLKATILFQYCKVVHAIARKQSPNDAHTLEGIRCCHCKGFLGVKLDISKLLEAQPLPVNRDSKVAEVNGVLGHWPAEKTC